MSFSPFAESFERYDLGTADPGSALLANLQSRYTIVSGVPEIVSAGRTGQAVKLNNSALLKTMAHSSNWVIGFAYQLISSSGDSDIYSLSNNDNIMARVLQDADGTLQIRAGNSTVIGVTTRALDQLKWYYIEISISLSGSTPISAAVEVRINGHVEVSGSGSTGINASSNLSGDATGNFHAFDGIPGTNQGNYLDDLYIKNTPGYYGDVRIIALYPNGEGDTLDWTPSTGTTHYTMVNSHPLDLSTWLDDKTPTDIDTWNWQDCPGFSGSIPAVNISMDARKDDEGTKSFKIVVGNTGSEAQSDEYFVGAVYPEYYEFGMELDPGTGLPWTQAGFNAKQFGVELIS